MKTDRPPILATWILDHLGDKYRRDALIGDLIEEYRRGRSGSWYWRQVLLATAAHARQALRPNWRTVCAILMWCGFWVFLASELKSVVLLLVALDPSIHWWFKRRRQAKKDYISRTPT